MNPADSEPERIEFAKCVEEKNAAVIRSDLPVVIQFTQLNSGQTAMP